MSELSLVVGQTATSKMTFDEIDPPADGAVTSDNPAVATISLDPTDHVSWTCVAAGAGTTNVTYTGTSSPPDAGPAVVPPMIVTVTIAPVAEHGDFDPTSAVIT
jgi:tartrate dehydratase alpha subunit/fumarate hydratase class I-like protein